MSAGEATVAPTPLRVRARSNRFDETDTVWLAQADELLELLTGHGVPVSRQHAAGSGDKGVVSTVIVAITSASGLTAAVEAWKAWLARDRTRWIELTRTVDGVEESFVLRGRDISGDQFDLLVQQLVRRLDPPA